MLFKHRVFCILNKLFVQPDHLPSSYRIKIPQNIATTPKNWSSWDSKRASEIRVSCAAGNANMYLPGQSIIGRPTQQGSNSQAKKGLT